MHSKRKPQPHVLKQIIWMWVTSISHVNGRTKFKKKRIKTKGTRGLSSIFIKKASQLMKAKATHKPASASNCSLRIYHYPSSFLSFPFLSLQLHSDSGYASHSDHCVVCSADCLFVWCQPRPGCLLRILLTLHTLFRLMYSLALLP